MSNSIRSNAPWSVKGVDRAARDAARMAAQEAGLTIGQWIDRAILRYTGAIEAPPIVPRPTPPAPPPGEEARDAGLRVLERQVERAERDISDQLVPVGKAVEGLARRLVDIEARKREADLAPPPAPPAPPVVAAPPPVPPAPPRPVRLLPDPPKFTPPEPTPAAGPKAFVPTEPVEPIEPPSEIIDFETRLKLGSEARVRRRSLIADPTKDEKPVRRRRRWGRTMLAACIGLVLLAATGVMGWSAFKASRVPDITWEEMPDRMVAEAQAVWTDGVRPAWQALRTELAALPLPEWPESLGSVGDWLPDLSWMSFALPDIALPRWLTDLLGMTPAAAPAPAPVELPPEPPPVAVMPPAPEAAPAPPPQAPSAPTMPAPAATVAPPVPAATAPPSRPAPTAPPAPPRPQSTAPAPAQQQATVTPGPAPDLDPAARVAWYENLAKQGDAKAQHDLAILYAKGEGTKEDFVKAAYWFREAAVQGVPNAQYNLGALYENGLGVAKDEVRALLWYNAAADLNHPNAQYNFGIYFLDGRGGMQRNAKEAVRWLKRAADQGVARALHVLGRIHEEGRDDIPININEAVQYYARAADRGYAEARAELARLGRPPGETGTAPARRVDPNAVPPAPPPVAAGSSVPSGAAPPVPTVARETVQAVQQLLQQLGLNPGPADGFIGPRTTAAIKRFQESAGVPADGLPSESVLRLLSERARQARTTTN
jgi:TPR repeat protein